MEKILVAGANGTTGKKIVDLLIESQYFAPIAMVRKKEQVQQFKDRGVDTVLADLEEDVSHTIKNIDKIIFAAGSGGKKVKEVDQEGAKKLIKESEKKNIKKFVMLSSMGADAPEKSGDLQEYLKAKKNADEFLRKSKIPFSIVRPGALNDDKGKGKIKIAEKLNEKGEISRDDVAQTLVRVLHDSAFVNDTFEIIKGNILIGEAIPN